MRSLGDPPEFGPGGEPPPVTSAWSLQADSLLRVTAPADSASHLAAADAVAELILGSAELPEEWNEVRSWLIANTPPPRPRRFGRGGLPVDPMTEFADDPAFAIQILYMRVREPDPTPGPFSGTVEIRRVSLWHRWSRHDPLTVLSPGSKITEEVALETGVTKEQTRELSASLGLPAATDLGPLSLNLSGKLAERVTLTSSQKTRRAVELVNDQSSGRRVFALWHVDHRLTVDLLVKEGAGRLGWSPISETEYIGQSSVQITSPG